MPLIKLLIVVNDLGFFVSHRLPIALVAKQSGYEVHIAFGALGRVTLSELSKLGLKLHFVPIERGGMNPFRDILSIYFLWRIFKQIKPDIIHLVTIKPVLYGCIAAKFARMPAVVSALTGLGFIFVERPGLRALLFCKVVKLLFRVALNHSRHTLIFQNLDDRDRVLAMTRVSLEQTRLISGSGIDLSACPVLPEPEGVPIIVMAARLLRDKGVFEFVEAARILHGKAIKARFWLVGDPDPENPASISLEDIAAWRAEGLVECFGYRRDVLLLYSKANIVVLPSYYGEGLPKSLIEGAACGRVVVTTDMPGCRDAIKPNISGFLVPPRNATALAEVFEKLINDSTLRKDMGKAGRVLAECEFAIEKVVLSHLKIYQELFSKHKSI